MNEVAKREIEEVQNVDIEELRRNVTELSRQTEA